MKRFLILLSIATLLAISSSIPVAGQEAAKHVSADKADYKEAVPGVSKAVLWGDPDKGAYGAFTKMAPGLDFGMHTHTNALWLVVHKGAYLYKDSAGEKRVGPGEFLWIPAGMKHWSGSDPKDGALFYEEASGSFDLVPAK